MQTSIGQPAQSRAGGGSQFADLPHNAVVLRGARIGSTTAAFALSRNESDPGAGNQAKEIEFLRRPQHHGVVAEENKLRFPASVFPRSFLCCFTRGLRCC